MQVRLYIPDEDDWVPYVEEGTRRERFDEFEALHLAYEAVATERVPGIPAGRPSPRVSASMVQDREGVIRAFVGDGPVPDGAVPDGDPFGAAWRRAREGVG